MDTFRKIVAGICAVLFVISGVAALLAFNIEKKAFTAVTYQQAFESQNLYVRMPEILANALHTSIAESANANPYLKPLTVEDWQATVNSLLPPEELKTLTDDTLNSVVAYVNGNADSAVISLLPLKKHLLSPSGVDVVKQILRVQPACTAEQLLQLGLGLLKGNVGLCNPPEQLMGLITPLIESQLQVMTVAIPDEVTLISGARSNTPNDPRIKLNRVRALMKTAPFFPLFFLFVISVFAIRNLLDWLKWWGYPFFIIGVLTLLMALFGSPIIDSLVQHAFQSQGLAFMPLVLLPMIQETTNAVTSQILKPVVIEGLIFTLLGLGMISVLIWHSLSNKGRV